jgi:ankyrin repeat protein
LLEYFRRKAGQQEETEIFDWLDLTKFDEQYNARHRYENLISLYLEGTCKWIFSKSAYCEWALDDSPNEMAKFLWICGPPGFGKTVLCARIIQHFKKKSEFPVAYFFSSAHAQSGGQPSAIVRSWIGQIARIDSDALDLVRGYRERSESGWIASETDIWTVFESIISLKRKCALFLDGFDEYARLDDIRAQFLQKLKKALQGTTTRILMTSKNETDIKTELSPETSQTAGIVMLKCEISKEDVRDDIALYSQDIVDRKLSKKDEALRKDLARQLAERCAGMFLWIKLQQDQLRGGKTGKQLLNIVGSIPFKLNETYERNWKTIQSRPGDEQKRALAILRWVTFALRPLTVSELAGALIVKVEGSSACLSPGDSPETIDDEYIDGEMIDICGCLIEAREEKTEAPASFRTIHLIHSSVREFLLSALPSNLGLAVSHSLDQAPSESEQHNHLARICLTFLNHEDVWKRSEVDQYPPRQNSFLQYVANLFDLPFDPTHINSFLDSVPNDWHSPIYFRHKHPFLHYAANHWPSHINRAGNDNNMVIGLANNLLCSENKNFDLWRRYFEFDDSTNATPLYYAVLFDLIPVMKFIWEKERSQLNSIGGQYGTPLQAACVKGHSTAFNLLIDWGADPNVEGGVYDVPLNAAIATGRGEMVKSLIKNGASLVFQDSMQQTPLFKASLYDKPAIVEFLLKAGANPNMPNKYGDTPLNIAADKGHLEVVKLLLDAEADITTFNKDKWTPITSASSNGHFEVVKLLLDRGADFTISSNEGWTSLNSASSNGHFEVVKLLLDRGADFTISSNGGWTPLNLAASKGHFEVVELLLDRGADIITSTNNGVTPLNLASSNGHFEVVKLLLDRGADITTSTNDGWTSLKLASTNGHFAVVKLLLDRGADITTSTNGGWTPLNSASSKGHFEVVKLLLDRGADFKSNDSGGTPLNSASSNGHFEVVKLLLDRGADFTSNNSGLTPLNSASSNGHLEVVKLLLDRGADFKSSSSGWTPLNSASNNGHLEVVKLLLDRGADFKSNNSGWTPLNSASSNGHFEVVELLLNRGADFKSDNSGWTPLNTASRYGHVEVVKLLLDRGADFKSDNSGFTPVYSAAFYSHLEVLKLLLGRGADATLPKNDRQLAFYPVAVSEGVHPPEISRSHPALQSRTKDRDVIGTGPVSTNSQPLEELVGQNIDVNLDGPIGMLIHVAAYKGNLKMLQMLVEDLNAHVFATDRLGRTPLHIAARGGNIDCVNYLLDRGLCCSDVDKIGNKAIHYACSSASAEVVRRVLELDPFVVDNPDTWTPLHWACRSGGFEVIHLLLSHGFHKSLVHTKHPSAWWTPVSIGVYHKNPYFESNTQQSLIEQLQVHDESCTGSFSNNEFPLDLRGSPHGVAWCNGCFHVSFSRNSYTQNLPKYRVYMGLVFTAKSVLTSTFVSCACIHQRKHIQAIAGRS